MPQFERKRLYHNAPPWVDDHAVYFITINTSPRGKNQLCHTRIADSLFESAAFRQSSGQWWMQLLLLMPDHLHALVIFNQHEYDMRNTIKTWKGWLIKKTAITWQHGFFDHRLRSKDSVDEKAHYIKHNPVRAGLVQTPEDWPYLRTAETLR